MDNIKGNITKKKTLKKIFCYFSLVILIVLLFLPLAFRIIFKDYGEEVKKDVVEILSCNKTNESISSTFINSEPFNLLYTITGNYSVKDETLEENKQSETSKEENQLEITPLMEKIKNYSSITYDEVSNISSFSVNGADLKGTMDYELVFVNLHNQEYYFTSQGFVCSVKTAD